MAERVTAVIPARLGSKRFPAKALYPYNGKPLLYYVWSDVKKSKRIDRLVIATDSPAIERAGHRFGAEVFRSKKAHATGSDRVAELASRVGGDIILNVQGDNFGLKGGQLDRVIDRFIASKGCPFGTMATRIHSDAELIDPNTVKVAVSLKGDALWFSRYPIPFLQRATATARSAQFNFRRHIGVYLFRNRGLRLFASWPRTNLERAESLEQLRMLEHGMRVQVFDVKMKSVSVDSPSDIEKLERVYR